MSRKRHTSTKHLGRDGVAQTVRVHVGDAGPRAGPLEHGADHPGLAEATDRCALAQKDSSSLDMWPGPLEIVDERGADVVEERKPVVSSPLSRDDELAGAPVDVLEAKADYLATAKAESA